MAIWGVKEEDFNKLKTSTDQKFKEIAVKLENFDKEIKTKATDSEIEAKEAAESAVQHSISIKTIEEQLKESLEEFEKILKDSKQHLNQINDNEHKHNELLTNLEKRQEELDKHFQILKEQEKEVEENAQSILGKSQELEVALKDVSELPAKYEETFKLLEESQTLHTGINDLLNESIKKKKSIDTLKNEILGYTLNNEAGETEKIPGIKHRLEEAYNGMNEKIDILDATLEEHIKANDRRYNDTIDNANKTFSEIEKKLTHLLPGAMAAGLSSAYESKANSEKEDRLASEKSFKNAIVWLVIVSFVPVIFALYLFFGLKMDLLSLIDGLPKVTLTMLPIYIPIFWVAYSSNKKSKLSKRLIEEYEHKASLGKVFTGLSGQIDNIGEEQEITLELRTKLLYNLLKASSENPGKLISDYNKSDHPMMEALENSAKLADSIEALAKVPGFGALSRRVQNNIKEEERKRSEKVERGLAPDEPHDQAES